MKTHEERLKQIKDWFDSEKGKRSLDEFWAKIEQDRQERTLYFQSERCAEALRIISDYLKDHHGLGDDDSKAYLVPGLTNAEFCHLFQSVFQERYQSIMPDLASEFHAEYVDHQGIRFTKVSGQGTYYVCNKVPVEALDYQI